jgi:hypothetical protein
MGHSKQKTPRILYVLMNILRGNCIKRRKTHRAYLMRSTSEQYSHSIDASVLHKCFALTGVTDERKNRFKL